MDRFDLDPESVPCAHCGEWYEDCACATFEPSREYAFVQNFGLAQLLAGEIE